MIKIVRLPTATPSLTSAVDAFFAGRDLAATTRRTYGATYRALIDELGAELPVTEITGPALADAIHYRWAYTSPTTWNNRIAAIQSLVRYCLRQGWLENDPTSALERRRMPRNETRAIPYEDLDALWSRSDVGLREKLLWRCLYSTAARSAEILALDIEDLDLARKRAVITGKGGHRETVVWDAGTARLFPRYLSGRASGPVFLTLGQPNVIPTDADRGPDGRARLSYQRVWSLFREASGAQWTLHQLRHSALTHLGEKGVAAPLLMAKSRHRDPRTLARYVQPGVEAVARLTAEHDPARRQREK